MNKHKVELERRRFLQLVGASALTYPFLRGVPSYAAASGSAADLPGADLHALRLRPAGLGRHRRERQASIAAPRRREPRRR